MTILFLAGEPSGDAHCARLARELRQLHPDWTIYAVGGPELREAGAQMLADSMGMGVIGFASAVAVYPRALKLQQRVLQFLRTTPVDLIIPCDWGAFNGRLLPKLRHGIKTLYYFPPRSWQKEGTGGVGIVPFCDAIATPFQWSAQRLTKAGARAEWVGHPLLEEVVESPSRDELRREFGLQPTECAVAILPGSRSMELRLLSPVVAGAARLLHHSGLADKFVVALPKGARLPHGVIFPDATQIVEGRTTDVLKACDAAIVKSGTSTLQAAVCGIPQVIIYDIPPLLRAQWKWTGMARKVRFVGMPNIIAGREICRELLGPQCRSELIAGEVASLLEDEARCVRMRCEYQDVRRALGSDLPRPATEMMVELVEKFTEEPAAQPVTPLNALGSPVLVEASAEAG